MAIVGRCATTLSLAGLLLLTLAASSRSEVSLKPSGFINDYVGLLSPEEKEKLENQAAGIEKKTTAEVAVVIVKELEGRNLEEYANELFNNWGIGKKGKDNGVLILVSLAERKLRIEVGYGLEEVLTDGRCGSIIRQLLVPHFRNQDYAGGLSAALKAMEELLSGKSEKDVLPEDSDRPPIGFLIVWEAFCLLFGWTILGLAGFLVQVALIAGLGLTLAFSAGQGGPSASHFLILLVVPFMANFLMLPVAAVIHGLWRRKLKKVYGRHWKDHWPVWLGSSSGGFSSGSSSGGGGFGGGSSGGGGASGGW